MRRLVLLFLVLGCGAPPEPTPDAGCHLSSYYPDVDGDGFGGVGSAPLLACEKPAGHELDTSDCADYDATAHPGTDEFHAASIAPTASYDYNCDGRDEQEHAETAASYPPACTNGCVEANTLFAWGSVRPPDCGASGSLLKICQRAIGPCLISSSLTVQRCR